MIFYAQRMEIQLFCFGFSTRKVFIFWNGFYCFSFLANESNIDHMLEFCLWYWFLSLCRTIFQFDRTHVKAAFLRLPLGWLTLSKCVNMFATMKSQINFWSKRIEQNYRAWSQKCAIYKSLAQSRAQQLSIRGSLWNWKIIWQMIKKPLSSSRTEPKAIHFFLSFKAHGCVWQSDDGNEWTKKCCELNVWDLFTFDQEIRDKTSSSYVFSAFANWSWDKFES